jgi:hypothetical protein
MGHKANFIKATLTPLMLGQIRILTLKDGNTLTTVPTRWLISGWKADDRDLHKNNKTQYMML